MKEAVRKRLLELNQVFYAQMATEFDQKRQGTPPGLDRLLEFLPRSESQDRVSIFDAGCGNGRFALILDKLDIPFLYVGVDGSAQLLALAEENTQRLQNGQARFIQKDFTDSEWSKQLVDEYARFDFVLCTAVLHHLPSYPLRQNLVNQLSTLTRSRLALSSWQFLTSERFVKKCIPWTEIGLLDEDAEPGDALLPWQHGQYMIRYVHQVDQGEFGQLASDSGWVVVDSFRSDGREGNLSLYVLLEPDR
ncbi:MAG: class I SAM-dependent methyltransferase [Chloroflexota bacterium]